MYEEDQVSIARWPLQEASVGLPTPHRDCMGPDVEREL